jgi:hypothetical protein
MELPSDKFIPPVLITNKFIARMLSVEDASIDYEAVMNNIDFIRATRGNAGEWPDPSMTLEEDTKDLEWHEGEFKNKSSFAYTLTSLDGTKCLGCFYLYPLGSDWRTDLGEDNDKYQVDFSWWVTEEYSHLYNQIRDVVLSWLKDDWGFERVYISNVVTTLEE